MKYQETREKVLEIDSWNGRECVHESTGRGCGDHYTDKNTIRSVEARATSGGKLDR